MSVTLLYSCKGNRTVEPLDKETLITHQSQNVVQIESTNGKTNYRAETALLERYELAEEPYMEFRKGIRIETYNDSTHLVESELVADYAKFMEKQELWEARGNVVAKNAEGGILETQQLFWDQKTDRIYSDVDSRITQGDDVTVGVGFETNSKFDTYTIRQPRGQVTVDTEPNRDSTRMQTDTVELTTNRSLSPVQHEIVEQEEPSQPRQEAPAQQPANLQEEEKEVPDRTD